MTDRAAGWRREESCPRKPLFATAPPRCPGQPTMAFRGALPVAVTGERRAIELAFRPDPVGTDDSTCPRDPPGADSEPLGSAEVAEFPPAGSILRPGSLGSPVLGEAGAGRGEAAGPGKAFGREEIAIRSFSRRTRSRTRRDLTLGIRGLAADAGRWLDAAPGARDVDRGVDGTPRAFDWIRGVAPGRADRAF